MQIQRVVIADDHTIVRSGIRDLLAASGAVDIVGEAEHGIAAIAAVKTHQPDLLFLDVAMPYAGGLEIIDEVRHWSPTARIVIFTGVTSGGVMAQLLRAQVAGILHKGSSGEEIQRGVKAILAGDCYVCDEVTRLASDSDTLGSLTGRERQVLQQIVSGASNGEIAERFNISPKTVDNHRTNLMRKLDVHSVHGLIQVAIREGLLAPGN